MIFVGLQGLIFVKISHVFEKFKEFSALTKKKCSWRIKYLRLDNGGEYVSIHFEE